jgi:hypothetical protein
MTPVDDRRKVHCPKCGKSVAVRGRTVYGHNGLDKRPCPGRLWSVRSRRLQRAVRKGPPTSGTAGLPAFQDAIRHLHGCESRHVETVPLHETDGGETVWNGHVEVFDLVGHPRAARAYAWSKATTGAQRQFFVVLHVPPVDSPVAALRVSILADVTAGAR